MKVAIPSRPVSKSSIWVMLSLFAGSLAALTAFVQPVQAQTSADLQTPVGTSDQNSNTNGDFGSVNNLFDLMHRVQQGSIRDPYQFSQEQQQSINSEASAFRQRQADLLKQQEQTGAASSNQIVAPNSQ
ncbi:MAG: hypothetical protein KME15_18230 [Drouetiella hepatica Uher 2000/2452]|jgi:hypothetical protein|uniref:Uncharacterized protein n=1 Tax=Drouetiella hepatica Uher 2000/2452 TaxID=904376 RepID=A0A951QDM3_9CYAN|nr:hypothetical protein [Drouetiella hepatica Uher 2000/2452]